MMVWREGSAEWIVDGKGLCWFGWSGMTKIPRVRDCVGLHGKGS